MSVLKRLTGVPITLCAAAILVAGAPTRAAAQSGGQVKVTALGSHAGEFCRNDRAMLFEDPTGLRILYDPGQTTDETDRRLGDVHVILLSHAHGDHLGGARPNPATAGTCAAPATVSAAPNSTLAAIAAAKNSAVFATADLAGFVARKIQGVTGSGTAGCAATGLTNELTVPQGAPCTGPLMFGASRTIRRAGTASGVRIATVPAFHTNAPPGALVEAPGTAPGTGSYVGPDAGFIITFTNGLTAYLTGDSGLFGDMETIIRRYYRPKLVVMNMGDIFTLGPDEAAFAISHLIMPTTVIPSHINEQSTDGGAVVPGGKLDRFIRQLPNSETSVVLALSGVTREFDQNGRCVGCR